MNEEQLGTGAAASTPSPEGAVTFLDVLGWKGIWLRHSAGETIAKLQALVNSANRVAASFRGADDYREVEVLSISDTIVLLSTGTPAAALTAHGRICANLLPESVHSGIPLRGATAYGEFVRDGNILVGPAVDEAASWHEALDWIGVVLTPSAQFRGNPGSPWQRYERTPVKALGKRSMFAVNWIADGPAADRVRTTFAKAGPLDPLVAVKYMNTLDFIDATVEREREAG